MYNNKIKFNTIIKSIISFMIFLYVLFSFSFFVNATDETCIYACNSISDCLDDNPEIITSCEFPGTCHSYCKYIIPDNITTLTNSYSYNEIINDNLVSLSELNKEYITSDNTTAIYGILNISSSISKNYFLFLLKDPNKIILSNLSKVHFNQKPFKITSDSIIFLLEKNSSVHLITYYIEPDLASKLIETNQTILSKNSEIRQPNISEKVDINLSGHLTPKLIKIIKVLIGFILIAIGFVIVFILFRRSEHLKESK
jgi:hypothetical protein